MSILLVFLLCDNDHMKLYCLHERLPVEIFEGVGSYKQTIAVIADSFICKKISLTHV